MRSGLIAQKLGMTRIFAEDGTHVPVTVLGPAELPGGGPADRRQGRLRTALQLGRRPGQGKQHAQGAARPVRRRQGRAQAPCQRNSAWTPTTSSRSARTMQADHFVEGQLVDVTGTSIGKGFAGAYEALELRRPACHARRVGFAPLARFDRPVARTPARPSRGKKMAGPHGRPSRHHAERQGRQDRRRARAHHGPGLGARRQGWLGS
jgi:large subunit ribosomal protein L3